MKTLTIALTVLLSTQVTAIEMIDCINDRQASIVIMEARQNGELMYDVMSATKSSKLKSRIKRAYTKVQHVSDKYKQSAIDSFATKYFDKCLSKVNG